MAIGDGKGAQRFKRFLIVTTIFLAVSALMGTFVWLIIPTIQKGVLKPDQTTYSDWNTATVSDTDQWLSSWLIVLFVAFLFTGPWVASTITNMFGFESAYAKIKKGSS